MFRKRRIQKICCGVCLASILSTSSFCSTMVFAEETYVAVDGNQVSEERLSDQLIEYDELGSLIHQNNVNIQIIINTIEKQKQDYIDSNNYLRSEKASAKQGKKDAKEDGDMEAYVEYATAEAIYSASISGYNKVIRILDSQNTNRTRVTLEKQLTNAAQSLFIAYQSILLQEESLVKIEDLYRKQYEDSLVLKQVGLVTEQETLTAYGNWTGIKVTLDSLKSSETSIYNSLCILLGVEENGSMEIQKISPVDLSRLDQLNLEEDTKKAIGSNTSIINTRHTSSVGSGAAMDLKTLTLDELEEKVTVKMEQLYAEVKQAKVAYDAAEVRLTSAEILWNNAGKKYSLGMLSESQYLLEEMQYIQSKVNYETADLNLFSALETYGWAKKGIANLE